MSAWSRGTFTAPAVGLAACAMLAMVLLAWTHVRWDHLLRTGLVQLDNLAQSRAAVGDAALFMERFLVGDMTADNAAVLVRLDRAVVFVDQMMMGHGSLFGMTPDDSPSAATHEALAQYRSALQRVRVILLRRMADPLATPSTSVRGEVAGLEQAAHEVETQLLQELVAARHLLHRLDVATITLVLLLALAALAWLSIAGRRHQRAAIELAASEGRLQAFAASMPGVSFLLDDKGIYEGVYGSNRNLLVAAPEELIGQPLHTHFSPEVAAGFLEIIREVVASGGQRQHDYTLTLPNGEERHFEGRICAVGDGRRVVWASWDVTDRFRAERRVRVLRRLYEFLSNINQAIVWTDERQTLFTRICEIAVHSGGFHAAWVSYLDEDGSALQTIAQVASGGDCRVPMRILLDAADASPTLRVFREGEVVIRQSEQASGGADQTSMQYSGIPLREHQKVMGVLNLTGQVVDAEDAEERALLNEVGVDISYALSLFARQQAQREVEARMRLHAAALESTQDAIIVTDHAGGIVSVNNAFVRITGFRCEEVRGQTPAVLHTGREEERFYPDCWQSALRNGHWQGEIVTRRSDGVVHPQWMTLSLVENVDAVGETHCVAVLTDLTQIKRTEARLNHLAHYDVLTGLPNRLFLHSRLEHALEVAARSNHYVGVLFVDLDNFKHINDALGHAVGDEVLTALAQRLTARLRKQDTLGRLGGDEFVLVLEALNVPQDAALVAQDLLAALAAPVCLSSGQEVYLLASIGIAIYPDDGHAASALISAADAAMYQAKKAGRGTYRYYTEALTAAANYRLELEARLRHAFAHDEFSVYFQPLISLDQSRLIGAEVLVRLCPPGMDPISPAVFIPLLEETGLIVMLGEWVMRAACWQGRAWLDQGYALDTLAINVSPIEIRRGGLEERLRAVLEETGFPPTRLELEITESGLMEQGPNAERFAQGLKALGVRLSIDDFGTGYSSLSYLRHLPVDKLKIDRSFIKDIPQNEADRQLASTIIAMARGLGLKVLAEGVETEAQLSFLREQGCDAFQGYLCSPPVPADVFARRFLVRDDVQTFGARQ